MLTVVRYVGLRGKTSYWEVRCDCGEKKVMRSSGGFKNGATKSCGCLGRKSGAEKNTIHGLSEKQEYKIWSGMIERCHNPNHKKYKYYGGRGIKVCDRWRESVMNFYADMGPRPRGKFPCGRAIYSIDRINNDGNYEPRNCRWATSKQQMRNTRRFYEANPEVEKLRPRLAI